MNITLSVDEQILKTVRKIAIDRDTTLTQMVRDYLISVAKMQDIDARQAARVFRGLTKSAAANQKAGERKLSREEMYAQRFEQSILGKTMATRKTADENGEADGGRENEKAGK